MANGRGQCSGCGRERHLWFPVSGLGWCKKCLVYLAETLIG